MTTFQHLMVERSDEEFSKTVIDTVLLHKLGLEIFEEKMATVFQRALNKEFGTANATIDYNVNFEEALDLNLGIVLMLTSLLRR